MVTNAPANVADAYLSARDAAADNALFGSVELPGDPRGILERALPE